MVIKSNGRKIVKNPLKLLNGQYQIDFDDLEIKASDPNSRILILCNPHQINKVNVFASVATEVAYRDGAAWLDALIVYIQGNVGLIREHLEKNAIRVSLVEPEGTFLVWLDFRELGLDAKELARFLAVEARIAISPGYWFGREGAGFARMTIGCPRATVERALDNIVDAVKKLS